MGASGVEPVRFGDGEWRGDALGAFVASTRPHGRVQVELTPEVSAGFCVAGVVELGVAGWAATVLLEGWSCSRFLCALSTLGGRPVPLLALMVGCMLVTVVLAALTAGFTRAGGGQLAVLTLTSVVGVGAALGALLALALVVVATAAGAIALLALFERC